MNPPRERPARMQPTQHRVAIRLLLALLIAACEAVPAFAHQYWLAPARYDAQARQPVEISAFAGTGFRGEGKPWSPGRCVRFVARTSRLIDLSRGAAPGETTWA